MFFGTVFFRRLIESFFFLLLFLDFSFLGFSSVPALSFRTLGSFEFGTDEEPQKPVQVSELQRTVCS